MNFGKNGLFIISFQEGWIFKIPFFQSKTLLSCIRFPENKIAYQLLARAFPTSLISSLLPEGRQPCFSVFLCLFCFSSATALTPVSPIEDLQSFSQIPLDLSLSQSHFLVTLTPLLKLCQG